ncbi:hypothetical protein NDU88_002864 [Pleurodeles waltl]|uniref:Uncharacterized protein n=1 Tax=Pleurodeles waltl TaxID=8319 RepID=A0AAV7P7V9_PLEWA|nr:hypothetical protein NDU88_002864 [Pleurodeles waltl]
MEVEARVLEAVALLRQAGRMDLLKDGALAPGRPARRASAGVAAAVAACSPPRVAGACKVRGASRGRGRRAGPGRARGGFLGGSVVGDPRGFPRRRDALCRIRAGNQLGKGRRGRRMQRGIKETEQKESGRSRRAPRSKLKKGRLDRRARPNPAIFVRPGVRRGALGHLQPRRGCRLWTRGGGAKVWPLV